MSDLFQVTFQKAGLYTTIQDSGRYEVQDLGIPSGGALDQESMQIANELVGNSKDSPVLEMTMVGSKFSFKGQGQIAITGADMSPKLNERFIDNYKTINVNQGDQLELGHAKTGCRAYMGIRGDWQITEWLGSFSSAPSSIKNDKLNSKIKDGDSISIESNTVAELQEYPKRKRPIYSNCYIIRVVTGPEFDLFDLPQIEDFFNKIFIVDPVSNRMGYRLKGELVGYLAKREEISSGIVAGTVQITNAGSPIVLMADAQTTGGYPRIANVLTEDLGIVAQMKPGDELKFMLVSM